MSALTIKGIDVESNAIILSNTPSDHNAKYITLNGYSGCSKAFWETVRCIVRLFTCGSCRFDPFLKVSIKDKTIYVLPSQIKNCYEKLNVELPSGSFSQQTLDTFLASNKGRLNINKSEPPVQPKPKKSVEQIQPTPTGDPIARIYVIERGRLRISSESVTKALFTTSEKTPIHCEASQASDCDAAIYICAHTQRTDWNEMSLAVNKLGLTTVPIAFIFVERFNDPSPNPTPNSKMQTPDEGFPSTWTCIHLIGTPQEGVILNRNGIPNTWNGQQIEKFQKFIQKHKKDLFQN